MTREEAIFYFEEWIKRDSKMDNVDRLENIEIYKMAIEALEMVEEFEKAQIITGGRLNGRTYAYKCGLEDGKRKALEQEPILDKIRAEIEDLDRFYDNDYFSGNRDSMFKCNEVMQIIDKYKVESEDKDAGSN